MVRLPQSPDLSITQSVWDYITRQKQTKELKSTERHASNHLLAKYLEKLCRSAP